MGAEGFGGTGLGTNQDEQIMTIEGGATKDSAEPSFGWMTP